MTEKIPTIENISSDFEIAQKDLRSAFANVTPKSWLYQYTENLEKMVHNGEFEKARNLLKKKQEMPDTLDYTKTEIQNILNAIDLYEPESIKQKTEHKEPLKIDMTGKDGTPEIKEEAKEETITEIQAQRTQRPRIQKVAIEKSISEKTTENGKPTNAYSTTTNKKSAKLEQGEIEYDDEKNFERKWKGSEEFEEEDIPTIYDFEDTDIEKGFHIDKKDRNQEVEDQDQKILLQRTTSKTMPKETSENQIEKVPDLKPEITISETEQKEMKEVHDVNREMVLMELKSLGMSDEQVAFNRKSANDTALLFLRDEYRKRETKDITPEKTKTSMLEEMKSLGADEALLKKASEVEIEDLEEMLGALRRKKERESVNTPVLTSENKNEKKEIHSTEAYLEKLLTPEKIEQIKAILKKGDFVLTTHGAKYTPPGGEETLVPTADLDGKISAYLFHEAGINWEKTNFVAPGQRGEGDVHVDTGEGNDLITIENGKLYIGNHYSDKRTPTSTAEIVDVMLKKCGLWEKDKENADWKKNLVSFVNGVDNMVLPGRGKEYMTKTFPKTLYGSESILAAKDFSTFIQLFKDGHKGEDVLPENIQNMVIGKDKKTGKDITLSQKITRDIEGSYNGIKKAFRDMAEGRIPSYSSIFGNIVVNNKDSAYISRREVAKDAGLTSITIHEGKGFFVSGTGKSLGKAFEEIKKTFPEAQLIRGTMILCFPQKEAFDQEKMRETLGLNYEQIPLDEKLSAKEKEVAIDGKIQEVTAALKKFEGKKDQNLTPKEWNEKRALETKLQGYQFQKEDLINPPKQKENKTKETKEPKEGQKNLQETNKQQELWNQAVLAQKEYATIHEKRKTISGTPEELDAYVEAHYNAWLKTDHYIKMLRGETTEPFKPVSKEEALRIVREGFNKGKAEAPLATIEKQEQKAPEENKKPEEKTETTKVPTEKASPTAVLEQTTPNTGDSLKVEKAKEEVARITQDIKKIKEQIEKGEKQGWLAKLFGGKRKLRENKEKLAELEFVALGQDERIHPVRHLFARGMSEDVRNKLFGNGNPTLETMSQIFGERDEKQDTLRAFKNIIEATDNIVYFTPSGFTLRLRNKGEITDKDGIRVNDPKALYDLVDPTGNIVQKGMNIEQGEIAIKEAARIYREKMQTSK
jgi:hypothetical protein